MWIWRAEAPVPIEIVSVVASPPIVMAVPPDAHVPPAVNVTVVAPRVVKTAAAGVVPPIAGAAAKTAGKFAGTSTVFVETRPATACALVAKKTIPLVAVVASGAPAIATLFTYVYTSAARVALFVPVPVETSAYVAYLVMPAVVVVAFAFEPTCQTPAPDVS